MSIYHREMIGKRKRYDGDDIGSPKDGLKFKWEGFSGEAGEQITSYKFKFDIRNLGTGLIPEVIQWEGSGDAPYYEARVNSIGGDSIWSSSYASGPQFPSRLLAQLAVEAVIKEIGQAILDKLEATDDT